MTQPAATEPADRPSRLIGSMGLLEPGGWCATAIGQVAWQQIATANSKDQAVVCLHDVGSGSREFQPLTKVDLPGARLVMIDWPGHGRSRKLSANQPHPSLNQWLTVEQFAAGLHAVLKHLDLEQPILLASGFGAAAALLYAAENPDGVKGLILIRPAGLIASCEKQTQKSQPGKQTSTCQMPSAKRPLGETTDGRAHSAAFSALRQAMRMDILRSIMTEELSAAEASLRGSQAGLQAALAATQCPVFFALSRDDAKFPVEDFRRFLMGFSYQFTVFAGNFHPLWEDPVRFSQALGAFVQAQLPVELHTHAWMLSAVDWPARGLNLWKCAHPACPAEKAMQSGQNANQLSTAGEFSSPD